MEHGLYSSTTPFTPPTTEDDRLSWLRLIRSRRVGPTTFHRLMAEHGSALAALDALPGIARAAGITGYEICPEGVARAELAAARKARMRMLCHGAPDYPPDLADLPDAPPVLWLRGDPGRLFRPMVALVGARNASSLGQRMAARLAQGLGAAGLTVVSGLARGIDAAAHQAALGSGTIAVLAGGADVIYPAENAALADRIAAEGAIVSEQPPGLEPQARHFPARNRIIAGLSVGVVVVEAAERSGSLITARNALDQGREVMAVPGHPADARAAGCNLLIRDGSTLIRSAADVLEAIAQPLARAQQIRPMAPPPLPDATPIAPNRLTEAARAIAARAVATVAPMAPGRLSERALAAIPPGPPPRPQAETRDLHQAILDRLGTAPLAEDQLIRDLALPPARVASQLLALELDGHIERRPGGLLSRSG
ncbi:DNA processing protein [Gemmobacter megaterium]|uniref:DNA processing protein n=1 Tax=Gemmobacter megaterium TaxID=1086013 RepID=A0A1N7NW43_9RHOB|nr:DNA-processing protein DprA [Gemmobacter megaterium]GGE16244.1 DNA processing protein DprA [Gemmobacter megaterium]SIT02615.1 DNA processing protein [Gemmobacter megaterium]